MTDQTGETALTFNDMKPWIEINKLFHKHGFSHDLAWRSTVWAAKSRPCPKCGALPNERCVNLSDRAKQNPITLPTPRFTKWPHTERVDYDLLHRTLIERGYR